MANEDVTDTDLQTLFSENPLAAEQLRRILSERIRDELQAQFDTLKSCTCEETGS